MIENDDFAHDPAARADDMAAGRPGTGFGPFLATVRRRWLLLVLVTVGVTLAVVGLSLTLKPVYKTVAKIKIDPDQRSQVNFEESASGAPPDQALIDTEVTLMESRDAARAIVRRFDLVHAPEFAPTQRGGATAEEEQTIDNVLARLEVARQGATYVIDLTYRSRSPARASQLANAFAEQYIENTDQSRARTARRQSHILDERLARLGADVRSADAQLAQYRANTGLMESGAAGTITEQQIAPLSSQLATAESEAASARAAVTAARTKIARGGLDAVSGVLASTLISDLRSKRADVLRDQGEISLRYGAEHPSFQRVTRQLADIDRQIVDESRRIVSGLESESIAATARVDSLRGDLARLRDEQARNTRATATAESLKRQAEARSNVFSQTSEAAQRIGQQAHGAEPNARIVENAHLPLRPTFPNKSLFAIVGAILGVVIGLIAVFIAEALSRRPVQANSMTGKALHD